MQKTYIRLKQNRKGRIIILATTLAYIAAIATLGTQTSSMLAATVTYAAAVLYNGIERITFI